MYCYRSRGVLCVTVVSCVVLRSQYHSVAEHEVPRKDLAGTLCLHVVTTMDRYVWFVGCDTLSVDSSFQDTKEKGEARTTAGGLC